MGVPNQLGTVENIRAKYPTPLGERHPAFLIELANATHAKLLLKDQGSHVTLPGGANVSMDILAFEDGADCYDVLRDAEGAADPTWQPKGRIDGIFLDVSMMGDGDHGNGGELPSDVQAALERLDARLRRLEDLASRMSAVVWAPQAMRGGDNSAFDDPTSF